ncbi:NADAR domain-containing protein [Pleurotus pulmonarius]
MGAVGSKNKEPKPYPFPFPHHPSQYNLAAYPPWAPGPWQGQYDDKYLSMMGYPTQHRKKKKGKNQMMYPAMGWAQGYAPFQGYPMPPYAPPVIPGMSYAPMMPMPMPQPAAPAAPANAPVIPQGATASAPPHQPVIPTMPTGPAQNPTQPPPLFTPGDGAALQSFPGAELTSPPPIRRSQTPFHRPSHEDSEESDDTPPPPQADLQRSASHTRQASHSDHIAAVVGSHTPAPPSAFGPPDGRHRPAMLNPLPPPPKDLYETSPYNTLLNLPQTTTLLRAAYGTEQGATSSGTSGPAATASSSHHHAPVVPPGADLSRSHTEAKKKGRFGLFRSLTGSGNSKPRHDIPPPSAAAPAPAPSRPGVGFVPVFAPADAHTRRGTADSHSISTMDAPHDSSSTHAPAPSNAAPGSHIPMVDQSLPPIRFTQNDDLAGFLNHSPHRVLHQQKIYPSATHLFEAMKYLEGGPGQQPRPDLAERIRLCQNIADVYPLSAEFQSKGWVRSDWGSVFNTCMDEVLYLKFRQHPNLRNHLMHTGLAPIIYEDPNDDYWSNGPHGEGSNELGLALVRVRAKLRADGLGV